MGKKFSIIHDHKFEKNFEPLSSFDEIKEKSSVQTRKVCMLRRFEQSVLHLLTQLSSLTRLQTGLL